MGYRNCGIVTETHRTQASLNFSAEELDKLFQVYPETDEDLVVHHDSGGEELSR